MESLHPQLAALSRELDDATARAKRLAASLDDRAFLTQPAEGRWSPAECLVHLNLTTKAFLPLIDDALTRAPRQPPDPAREYPKGVLATLFAWMMEPPARIKVKTPPPFVPKVASGRADVLAEFERFQGELAARISAANSYDLSRLKVRSPFASRVSYSLIAAMAILLAHERRHLWQAERAATGS